MIDKLTIDKIYSAANIVEVVGDFVTLKKKGVNYQACCPFHNEKTPSFVVSPSKGLFKCFGCGKGGNAVTFVMEHEGMAYPDALKYVAKKYGIEVEEREISQEEQKRNDDRESMMIVSGYAADYFRDRLHNSDEGKSIGIPYFRERGFSDPTISKFGLGYCPAVGDSFTRAALDAGYKEEFLVSTGLTIVRESGGWWDRFAGRVIFPIHSVSGRVVGFGGRTLRTDKKVAKYLNSPESEIYHKSNILYGLFFAKAAITQEDCCILVEGYTDVLSMHQAGVQNVVASSGTSLTQEQIRLIKRFTHNVTVIYDGDSAGIKASLRGIDMILAEGLNVRVVLLPEGDDPDSFARSHSTTELKEYIRSNEVDFISFKASILLKDAAGDPIKKAALIADIVQSVSVIPDPITRSVYTGESARLLGVDEQLISGEVARKLVTHTSGAEASEFIRRQQHVLQREQQALQAGGAAAGSSIDELERELVKYLLKYGGENFDYRQGRKTVQLNVAEIILGDLQVNELTLQHPQYRVLFECYRELHGSGEEGAMHHYINHSDPAVCNAAVDILTSDDNYTASRLWQRHDVVVGSELERLPVAVPRVVILYKSKVIEQIIADLNRKLKEVDPESDDAVEILSRIAALNHERIAISKIVNRTIL